MRGGIHTSALIAKANSELARRQEIGRARKNIRQSAPIARMKLSFFSQLRQNPQIYWQRRSLVLTNGLFDTVLDIRSCRKGNRQAPGVSQGATGNDNDNKSKGWEK
jgi:hypothetical protein